MARSTAARDLLTFRKCRSPLWGDDGAMEGTEFDSGINHGALLPLSQETVARVLYASQAKVASSVYAEMERIRAAAMRHNPAIGVYTALLYQSGWFVQWKEGPGDSLRQLMDRVSADPRHHSIRIVHSSRGPRMLPGPWSMAIVQRAEDASDMTDRVQWLRHRMETGEQFSPPAVWRQLSTPLPAALAARLPSPDAYQRILVCASATMASFEMIRWLALRSGQAVVRRRYAGSSERDVGTDLVDFLQDGRVVRVVAMARGGLTLPLTCALMPDFSHIVLLLCGTHAQNLALVHKVALECAGVVSPPVLLGMAALAAEHEEPAFTARRLGLRYVACHADPGHFSTTWESVQAELASEPGVP